MATKSKAPATRSTRPARTVRTTTGNAVKAVKDKSGKHVAYPTAHSLPAAKFASGAGGEVHQVAADRQPRLTTNHGVPISDDFNSLKAGPRGPTLLEDFA